MRSFTSRAAPTCQNSEKGFELASGDEHLGCRVRDRDNEDVGARQLEVAQRGSPHTVLELDAAGSEFAHGGGCLGASSARAGATAGDSADFIRLVALERFSKRRTVGAGVTSWPEVLFDVSRDVADTITAALTCSVEQPNLFDHSRTE